MATLLGMVLGINPLAALICLAVFLIVLLVSKHVSLGSMLGTLTFPLLLLITNLTPKDPILIIFGFFFFFVVLITHTKNIKRILQGTESKVYLRVRKK